MEAPPPSTEEPRYRLVPLPDMTSKYCVEMEIKEAALAQAKLDKIENERLRKIAVYPLFIYLLIRPLLPTGHNGQVPRAPCCFDLPNPYSNTKLLLIATVLSLENQA